MTRHGECFDYQYQPLASLVDSMPTGRRRGHQSI